MNDETTLTPVNARPRKKPGEHYRTPLMSLRVPADLQAEVKRIAAERGETVSDVIRRALEAYVRKHR